MRIQEIIEVLETFAPLSLQESYDNSGLQVGDAQREATGALLTLDVTEDIIDDAISRKCNLVIAHHPLIFSGLKSLTGRNYVERTLLKAIRNDICIYAAHTNFDNVRNGVNHKIADRLGLHERQILAPTADNLLKLHTYIPLESFEKVRRSLFDAGAGHIGNYAECGFSWEGRGTFKPMEGSRPAIGEEGGAREEVKEMKLEVILPQYRKSEILRALKSSHPYEEVAYEFVQLQNENQDVGAGMVGNLKEEMDAAGFLDFLKTKMETACIRHSNIHKETVKRVAVCGGSGSFLLQHAIKSGADVFVTGDFKYHQFFDTDDKIMICDIGHFESEQFTIEIFSEIIKEKFRNFATYFAKKKSNPINYYF